MEREIKVLLETQKKLANALKPYAKFDGTFNDTKTELTVEKFPIMKEDGTVEEIKAVFKKS